MFDFSGKRVLVAGGTGLIGTQLTDLLIKEGARVRVASLDEAPLARPEVEFIKINLLDQNNCLLACRGMDYVFNLLCVKGSAKTVKEKPALMFDSNLHLDTHLLPAALKAGVQGYLLTSSLAVYPPAEVFYENDVWKGTPSSKDWFAGWAKRMGELQVEAYRIQYGSKIAISVVRPANTYGPHDDFWSEASPVVPTLIKRVVDGENPLVVWGDGSQIRDFIYSRDSARGMLLVAKQGFEKPVNLGSGREVSIKELVQTIIDCVDNKPEVIWDVSKPSGDKKRVLDISRARSLGFQLVIPLSLGIKKTIEWYKENKHKKITRYDAFAN